MATGTDQGDGSGERLSGRVGYLDVVQRKRALVSGQRAGKQRGSRGFAGTGDADDGGELTGVGSEGEVGERRCRRGIHLLNGGTGIGAVIGIADVVEADGDSAIGLGPGLGTGISPDISTSGGRQRGSAMGGLGGVQQGGDTFGGGHAVHRHVEVGAELAHGDEEFGGQQHNQQQSGEGEREARTERHQVLQAVGQVGECAGQVGGEHDRRPAGGAGSCGGCGGMRILP